MLAYVFWHWARPGVAPGAYEAAQRAFHASLAAAPAAGYAGSFSVAPPPDGLPWVSGGAAYEDWYLVEDFTALGALNEAAVSGARAPVHDVAAAGAAGGTGGLYRLRHGRVSREPRHALWFGKPDGMRYDELFTRVTPLVERAEGALWVRQLTLGPAREFCLHTVAPVNLPATVQALAVALRPVWPEPSGRSGTE
jgi:hypothetical protein